MRNIQWCVLALGLATPVMAQSAPAVAQAPAPISGVRYDITFNRTTAAVRTLHVDMHFDAPNAEPVRLLLPVWTPGAYEVSDFAQNITRFNATSNGAPVDWDKTGPSGWRVTPGRAGRVTVSFDYVADSLDNSMAWSKPDFLLVNGTNIFMYQEGASLDFPATVSVRTESDWKIATGMKATNASTFGESNFHDLVDKPFFIGAFDLDSALVGGKYHRIASYPASSFTGAPRQQLAQQIGGIIGVQHAVFDETPWDRYTTMLIFDESTAGGSALEHTNSHVGIYNPQFRGNPLLALISGHEIFHAWNVKRLRPADLVPYRYQSKQPTPWLWVSEGITDYYADLSLFRAKVLPQDMFIDLTNGKIQNVESVPPVALEDASLSTWFQSKEGDPYIYYPKGSLAGMLLDIIIRDATDNRSSLDVVLRELYAKTYKAGRGFTSDDWWGAVSRAANGKSFTDFNDRYIDGREPFPYDQILPLAGFKVNREKITDPRIGINTQPVEGGVAIISVVPGGMAQLAGVQAGDVVTSVGGVATVGDDFGAIYRQKYATTAADAPIAIVLKRNGQELTLNGKLRFETRTELSIAFDPNPSPSAKRIRDGILGQGN